MTLRSVWAREALMRRERARAREELRDLVRDLESTAWSNCWDEDEGSEMVRSIEAFVELVLAKSDAFALASAWKLGGWAAVHAEAESLGLKNLAFFHVLKLASRYWRDPDWGYTREP